MLTMHINPRSVLRPEYFKQSHESSIAPIQHVSNEDISRINTNTAPVYWVENPCVLKKKTIRRQNHPYVRYSQSILSGTNVSNQKSNIAGSAHPALRRDISTINSTIESSDSDDVFHETSSSPSPSFGSRYSSDSTTHSNLIRHDRSRPQNHTRDDYSPHPKAFTHGQAEQLRRSRESNTFALIDAQLSTPPLNQVRDMYLQNRSGCNSGSNSSAARTTKKANLSVVHTVVRFRVKDYVLELREHIRRLLDTLFCHLFDDYDPKTRESMAMQLFGLSHVPCSPDCQFCPSLFNKSDRHSCVDVASRHRYTHQNSELRCRIATPFQSESTFHQSSASSTSSSNTPVLSGPDATLDFLDTISSVDRIKSDPDVPPTSPISIPAHEYKDNLDVFQTLKMSPIPTVLTGISPIMEKPLPYHLDASEIKGSNRLRLDSTSLRLVNDFDSVDWSAEDIDIGPFGEEPVDLHSLITDPNAEIFPFKCEDPFFDSAHDLGDLLHQFTIDKHPNLQLTISP